MTDEAKARPHGLFAFLFDELRAAIQDVRQKVVEEGWFGRVVTPAPVVQVGEPTGRTAEPSSPSADHADWQRRPSFDELMARKPTQPADASRQQEQGLGW